MPSTVLGYRFFPVRCQILTKKLKYLDTPQELGAMMGTRTPLQASLVFLFLVEAAAGCVGSDVFGFGSEVGPLSPRPVIVAIIDSGINPYHEAFRAREAGARVDDHLSLARDRSGVTQLVSLTNAGGYADRRGADEEIWESVEPERLYAFSGTRVFAISFLNYHTGFIIEERGGHGTGTSGLVARDAPDSLLVMVDVDMRYCEDEAFRACMANRSISEGMTWAAQQPWIDVISVSLGFIGNTPDTSRLHPEMHAYLEASRRAHASGKIIVNGAGNHVVPPLTAYFNGPPWVIAAGGAEPGPRGESVFAAKSPDVVANFTDEVAFAGTLDGYIWASGTSYSTPIVAGVLSRALHDVRRTLHHAGGITADGALAAGTTPDGRHLRVTAASLRAALNASAIYFAPTEWDPTNPTAENDTIATVTGVSQPVVVPFAQMGWGYVHAGLAGEIARRVLEEDLGPPPEKAAAAVWMGAVQAAREEFWENWG